VNAADGALHCPACDQWFTGLELLAFIAQTPVCCPQCQGPMSA